jgi:hypothetical protein
MIAAFNAHNRKLPGAAGFRVIGRGYLFSHGTSSKSELRREIIRREGEAPCCR